MPNWCQTRLTINHENTSKLKEFETLIDKWTSKNYIPNGFGLNWLGNIVGNSGIGTVDEGEDTDLRCRGEIIDTEVRDKQLVIDTETAWSPMLKMWTKLLEKYLPGAELIFVAREDGNCFYSTNDPYLKGRYVVDACLFDGVDSDYEASEDYVREILQELLKSDDDDVPRLLKRFEKSEYKNKLYIDPWEFDKITDWA